MDENQEKEASLHEHLHKPRLLPGCFKARNDSTGFQQGDTPADAEVLCA